MYFKGDRRAPRHLIVTYRLDLQLDWALLMDRTVLLIDTIERRQRCESVGTVNYVREERGCSGADGTRMHYAGQQQLCGREESCKRGLSAWKRMMRARIVANFDFVVIFLHRDEAHAQEILDSNLIGRVDDVLSSKRALWVSRYEPMRQISTHLIIQQARF